jgi:molybdopterin converting factor small subunit
MAGSGTVTVEFYGIPRQRAGRAELVVRAGTVAEVLASVQKSCPGLAGLLPDQGRLAPEFLLSIDGQRFAAGLSEQLRSGQRLLLLSADAGG